jgi:hypothetical protein
MQIARIGSIDETSAIVSERAPAAVVATNRSRSVAADVPKYRNENASIGALLEAKMAGNPRRCWSFKFCRMARDERPMTST